MPELLNSWATSSRSECLYGAITPVAISEGVCGNADDGQIVLARARAILLTHAIGEGLRALLRLTGGRITRINISIGFIG